jgi:hypothetical protein
MAKKPRDPKAQALQHQGALHRHAEQVTDELFVTREFFDPRDLVQVKYEMLRRTCREGAPVQTTAPAYGFSRVAWYQIKARFDAHGLLGLLPQPRGPRQPPKKRTRPSPGAGSMSCVSNTNSSGNTR